MTQILDAIVRAFRDLFQFKVLWIVIWPMLASVLLWLVLGVVFWNHYCPVKLKITDLINVTY